MKSINPSFPLLMAILNRTPDSFYDGDPGMDHESLVLRIEHLIKSGADLIDIGGESTRPGSMPVTAQQEMDRIMPAIREIRKRSEIPISLDTRKASVVRAALEYGISIVNDVSALNYDDEMVGILQRNPGLSVVLMHCQGEPATMQIEPHYEDVIGEITLFFAQRIAYCEEMGITKDRIILDPGIGFGKNLTHNLAILRNLSHFHQFGVRLMLGASRKRFIDNIIPSTANDRLPGTLAAAAFAMEAGVDILRVHDIAEHRQFAYVYQAIGCDKDAS